MQKFDNKEEYKNWVDSQQWYQTIKLKDGLETKGSFPTYTRSEMFDKFDFDNKTVLDIGCNSGQYSFFAKGRGASSVLGIDVLEHRIEQAKTLSLNEGFEDITFEKRGIFDLTEKDGKFDVVLCVAVLTEIADFFGAAEKLKKVIGEYAIVELDIAKPLLYLSKSRNWLRGNKKLPRQKAVAEIRYSKTGGWVISPTMEVLQLVFGDEFTIQPIQGGLRYDLVKISRKK